MQKRRLGNTDLEFSVIGFGAWAIGGGEWEFSWGPQDDDQAIAAMKRAIDCGINWIDTAAVYGLGHSEELVGQVVREVYEKPYVATKCGLSWDSSGRVIRRSDRKQVFAEVEASLKRLKIEAIDLYQLHWPKDDTLEETWQAMADVKRQGKARHIGVSNHSVEQMERIAAIHPIASLQPQYSMLHRQIEAEVLPFCEKNKIGVVCYSPMAKGILTGKMTAERVANFAKGDHRRNDPDFRGATFQAHLKLVESLRPIAQRNGKTLAQLALVWVLRKKEVTAAIAGARNPQQIDETAKAGDWNLGADDIAEIEELIEQHDMALSH